MRQYQDLCKIIAIRAVNNFTAHKILIARMGIFSDTYKYQTTNNFEKLLAKEDNKNTTIITALILISICMYIGSLRFLEDGVPKVVYGTDGKIQEELVILF